MCTFNRQFREGAKQAFTGNLKVCVNFSKTMLADLFWCFVVCAE